MVMEESLHKSLYKIELYFIKVIPMLLAGCDLTNTILSYFYIDAPIVSYIGGSSILEIIFLYISSYVFRFCSYHRMFIHYIVVNHILSFIDYEYGLPIKDRDWFLLNIIIAGVFLFIIIWLKIDYSRRAIKYIDLDD